MKDIEQSKQRLKDLITTYARQKGLISREMVERIKLELREVFAQGEQDYFLDLHDEHIHFNCNENNLIIPYLLGIVDDFDLSSPPVYIYGEFPDIDIDYLPMVRDYLKNEWAPDTFGSDHVCNIGNYTTFGIKSALIDMAKVHGLDRAEVLRLTTKLPSKDDDGKDLTLDKAKTGNKDLTAYCEQHPEVAIAAQKLVGRNRGKGKHAGGLIISISKIDELVPLIVDTDGTPTSAWPEGLHSQDLQPVGLVKFDLLVITNLMQIALCIKLIKDRHGITIDWSDTSYLNDEKALSLANDGKLKGIFQFDSDGIRELVRKGGVTSFDDLVAYSALYRPGPMGEGMHERYVARKNHREDYVIHPIIEPVLGGSHNVMVYQEQIMRILNVVGDIPMWDTYKVLKGISKKNVKIFDQYQQQFIKNGVKNLGWDEEAVKTLWDQVVAFSGYGFNKSHAVCYTYISSRLLYLKAHYPLEFFAAILSCEDDGEKIKDYRLDAEKFDITINRVNINKSGVKFEIRDGEIYMGLSNVKGIGVEVAKRIVENQPYASFEDFLHRFGTDASVLKALIGLRVFSEADPVVLYEFYDHYKNETKKRQEREKRNIKSRENIFAEFRYLLKQAVGHDTNDADDFKFFFELLQHDNEQDFTRVFVGCEGEEQIPGFDVEQGWKVMLKYKRCVEGFDKKVAADPPIRLAEFEPTGDIGDKELQAIYTDEPTRAETIWYGFGWVHPLEKSPDYKGGWTFEVFQTNMETRYKFVPLVEVQVTEAPKEVKTKKGGVYYTVLVQDANFHTEKVTLWPDDYERFKEEFQEGNLLRIRLEPPQLPYKTYKFESPPRYKRQFEVAALKKDDHRLEVLRKPPVEAKIDVAERLKSLSLE